MNQRRFYFTSILVYKCINGLTFKTLSDCFNKPLDVHNIETRFAKNNNLCLPHPRTNYMKKGFSYTWVNSFNKLPLEVKKAKFFIILRLLVLILIIKACLIVNNVYLILYQIS